MDLGVNNKPNDNSGNGTYFDEPLNGNIIFGRENKPVDDLENKTENKIESEDLNFKDNNLSEKVLSEQRVNETADKKNEDQKKEKKEDFTLLYEDSLTDLKEKTIVKGKVILVTKESVMVDVGAKSEGDIPIEEFNFIPKINDEIDVYILKLEQDNGAIKISHKRA